MFVQDELMGGALRVTLGVVACCAYFFIAHLGRVCAFIFPHIGLVFVFCSNGLHMVGLGLDARSCPGSFGASNVNSVSPRILQDHMPSELYTWGAAEQQVADNDMSFWARVRIEDLRYTQDTCSEVFSRSPPHLATHEDRKIHKLRDKFGDDPDPVLAALKIWLVVVVHGGKVFSINNRRAWCIKNCDAPARARIWVKLFPSPGDYNQCYGPGSFERYYSTTCEGKSITLTEPHYEGNLARELRHRHVAEAHVDLPVHVVDEVRADDGFLKKHRLLQVLKMRDDQVLLRGVTQHDVDLAVGFLRGRYHLPMAQASSNEPAPQSNM